MKRMNIVLALLIIFTATSFAGNSNTIDNKLQLATNGYIKALKSDNLGVRNSALHQLTILKAKYPDYDLRKVVNHVKKISKKDSELLIRLNADITYRYLTNREMSSKVNVDTIDPKIFFQDLYGQVANIE